MNTSIEENLCGRAYVSFSIESDKQVDLFASQWTCKLLGSLNIHSEKFCGSSESTTPIARV